MNVPPGITYLVQRIPRILTPPIIAYALVYLGKTHLSIQLSGWGLSSVLLLSLPVGLTLSVLWKDLVIRWDASAKGAVLPPISPDPFPGGARSLYRAVTSFKTGYPVDGLEELCGKFGGYTFMMKILFEYRVVTAEPEHIKAMLATQFEEFEKGPETRLLFHPLLGTGVFAADGELWKFHRTMTRPFFSKDRISHFDNFNRHADDALGQLLARLREGHAVDFQDLISRFTLDSATEFLFGNDVHSLAGGLPYPYYHSATSTSDSDAHPSTRFVHAFQEAQMNTAFRMRFGSHWPLFEFWHDKVKKPMRVVHDFIDPIVAAAINRKKAEMLSPSLDRDDETLLENLVNSTEDPIILRDEIMSLLVAGRDTTASTLTFTVYMLAEHPRILQRLREEIFQKVGPRRRPTYDDFREMKFLRAVINETLRLYPVVPSNIRMSNRATTWPSKVPGGKPWYIPANTRSLYSVFLMHRRTDLWGPDALEFDPDRFLDERLHKYLTPNPFIFLPFNAGPRICLGQQFAYHEASFFLVRLLQNFSAISLASHAQPPESRAPAIWAIEDRTGRKGREKIRPRTHLTMYVQDGLWVTMEEEAT